ncbi:AAA family ATPase [Mycolicibacterium sediminis]|uniref:AAA family ATPase n=1 Tax=Mycolicibacterium sediminis TaxID=1286180 RepID=UPI0013D6EB27|nr:AAA family ATPase [Mycolicibacterium sediminis]
MLMWINGAFGSGKTQTAFELHRRIAGSHVADPELIGFAIQKTLPAAARGDFQDRPQWRAAVVATLIDAVRANPDGPVLVPMTLVEAAYFDEVMGGLAAAGVDVRHFALIASPETLRRRLQTRSGYWVGRAVGREETWGIAQITRCVTALATDRFAEHVDTDDRAIDDVVEDVAARAGVPLTAPKLGPVRYQFRRAAVGIRHVRL